MLRHAQLYPALVPESAHLYSVPECAHLYSVRGAGEAGAPTPAVPLTLARGAEPQAVEILHPGHHLIIIIIISITIIGASNEPS